MAIHTEFRSEPLKSRPTTVKVFQNVSKNNSYYTQLLTSEAVVFFLFLSKRKCVNSEKVTRQKYFSAI